MHHHLSEIARLREQIAREHEAACWAMSGPALGTAQHWFITRRYARMGACQTQLARLIGEAASMAMLVEVMESAPAQPPAKEK